MTGSIVCPFCARSWRRGELESVQFCDCGAGIEVDGRLVSFTPADEDPTEDDMAEVSPTEDDMAEVSPTGLGTARHAWPDYEEIH